MKTPIQQLISDFEKHAKIIGMNEVQIKGLVNEFEKQLPNERRVIEQAYRIGQSDPEIVNCKLKSFCTPSDYFTETFKTDTDDSEPPTDND